jgi:hypothetical protein
MRVRYTTVCDSRYVAPALALYRSVEKVSSHSLGIYTLDEAAVRRLDQLDLLNAQVFRLQDYVPENFLQFQRTRRPGAFAFTVKSLALIHAMDTDPDLDWVGYLDADIGLFADPVAIIEALPPDKSACFTPHRFSPSFRHYEASVGHYNAGYVSFKNDLEGRHVLESWRDMCFEWCQDYVEADRYGDQKYLEDLADRYPSVASCAHKGANAAPWNISDARVYVRNNRVFIEDDPLLFYHFQGLKVYSLTLFDLYASTELIVSGDLLSLVYVPYIESLQKAYCELMRSDPDFVPSYTQRSWKNMIRFLAHRALGKRLNVYRVQRAIKRRCR